MIRKAHQAGSGRWKAPGWRHFLLWCTLLITPAVQAEDAYEIKAAFIFNFTKFISWPADMEQAGGDLHLCLFSSNPFGDYVYQLNGRKVRNFYLRVSQPAKVAELAGCHILFLADAQDAGRVVEQLAAQPVLTISDHDGFVQAGGGINLFPDNDRIRFDVNLQRLKGCGLDVSSKLLSLARQVY